MADSRTAVGSIVDAVQDARDDFLQYEPPWMDPGYEDLRIALDRKLRNVQLAIIKLFDEVAKAPTEPPVRE
jgi:hypothetical protein